MDCPGSTYYRHQGRLGGHDDRSETGGWVITGASSHHWSGRGRQSTALAEPPCPSAQEPVLHRHLAVESRQKIQNSGLPLRSRRARRVLKSRAALMLAQRAPGETAFGCVHQPTSMAAGLATRARLHPVPRRPRGTRPTCFLNQDKKGSFFLRVFAVMAQLSRASRSRYRPSRDRPEKKSKRRPLTA